MQKKNLVVFDIDGTLTDTVAIHQHAFKKSIHHIGVEKFNDAFGTYEHHTDKHIAKVIFESVMDRSFDSSVIALFEQYLYDQISLHEIIEIRGAKQIVYDIETKTDFGICYATGSLLQPAMLKLDSIGIDYAAIQLTASNEIEEREKIVEKAINNAKKHYEVQSFERIISFGDGIWDLKTANNLSLEFIGIGKANEKLLRDNGVKKHFLDFNEFDLMEIISTL